MVANVPEGLSRSQGHREGQSSEQTQLGRFRIWGKIWLPWGNFQKIWTEKETKYYRCSGQEDGRRLERVSQGLGDGSRSPKFWAEHGECRMF